MFLLAVMNTSDLNSEEEVQDQASNDRVKPFQRLKSETETESEAESAEEYCSEEQSVNSDVNVPSTHTPVRQ